ncbi:S-layer homology domain-containing protein [Cellulosilyticum sp. I15G10I2]|uniref:S-layer homology domain-containing protein n=1 Tax=Cellulosilyticum sp. I15G10I2 TaxID=1892843 RepID=UPI0009F5E38A|nr:S-layer homology domain-containing protein [Cellulosilyticum sp. I15G10I2]
MSRCRSISLTIKNDRSKRTKTTRVRVPCFIDEIAFIDIENSTYKEAIKYCTRVGLISGMDSTHMAPSKALTRAELMSILIRLNDNLK